MSQMSDQDYLDMMLHSRDPLDKMRALRAMGASQQPAGPSIASALNTGTIGSGSVGGNAPVMPASLQAPRPAQGGPPGGAVKPPQQIQVDQGNDNPLETGADAARKAISGNKPPSMESSGGGSGLDSMNGGFMDLIKRYMTNDNGPLSDQEKALGLAAAGFGAAASGSPYALQAIGQGGLTGIQAIQQARQQRALDSLKAATALNQFQSGQSLRDYRGTREAQINQTMGFADRAVLKPEEMQTLVDNAVSTGDVKPAMAHFTGPAGAANKATFLRMLQDANPDLAKTALSYATATSEAKSFGAGQGERAAGTFQTNPSQGQTTPPPVAPLDPRVRAPGAQVPVQATTPVVNPPPPPALTVRQPAPAPKVAPSIYDALPIPVALPQSYTPGGKRENEGQGEDLSKLAAAVDANADAAIKQQYIYNNMDASKPKFVGGKGSTVWNEANAYLLQAGNALNAARGPDNQIDLSALNDKISNYQDFKKNGVNLVGAATKAVSPRAAVQEMNFLSQGVPNNEMTDKGYDLIMNQLHAVSDFSLAQQKAKNIWLSNPKNTTHTLNGFDGWFNENIDPSVFMLHRMSPEDASAAISYVKSQPHGDAMANKIANQMEMAQRLGLFAEQ